MFVFHANGQSSIGVKADVNDSFENAEMVSQLISLGVGYRF